MRRKKNMEKRIDERGRERYRGRIYGLSERKEKIS